MGILNWGTRGSPFVFRDKGAPFLGVYRKGTLHVRVLELVLGEKYRVESESVSLSFKYSLCHCTIFGGSLL